MAKATTSAKISAGLDVLQAGMDVASTISNIKDSKKRFELDKASQYLSLEEKAKLQRELAQTNSLQARIQLVADTIAKIKESQEQAIQTAQKQAQNIIKKNREKNKKILIIGGSIIILIAIVILVKSK